jgi:hypothetical protein
VESSRRKYVEVQHKYVTPVGAQAFTVLCGLVVQIDVALINEEGQPASAEEIQPLAAHVHEQWKVSHGSV